MARVKYIRLDVHRDTISVDVVDQNWRLVIQSVITTHSHRLDGGIRDSGAAAKTNHKPQFESLAL
jgi:hypothetical protein